jgi:hypothetical protein
MLGSNISQVGLLIAGEIDILEYIGKKSKMVLQVYKLKISVEVMLIKK